MTLDRWRCELTTLDERHSIDDSGILRRWISMDDSRWMTLELWIFDRWLSMDNFRWTTLDERLSKDNSQLDRWLRIKAVTTWPEPRSVQNSCVYWLFQCRSAPHPRLQMIAAPLICRPKTSSSTSSSENLTATAVVVENNGVDVERWKIRKIG